MRALERASGMPIAWYRGDQYGDKGGRFHFHLLVSNVAHVDHFEWMRRWERMGGGFARIYPYDPDLGAAYYESTFVTKQLGESETGGDVEAFRVNQPVLPLVGQRKDREAAAKGAERCEGSKLQRAHAISASQKSLIFRRIPYLTTGRVKRGYVDECYGDRHREVILFPRGVEGRF